MSAATPEVVVQFPQYITWGLVVAGWCVTILVAWLVLRKNARNSWVGDIKKLIISIEDSSIDFWTTANTVNEALELRKLRREVKDITTLAMEIKSYGGACYPSELFKQLRRAVTVENYIKDSNKLERQLPVDDYRINEISEVCADLRNHYTRT